MLTEQELTELEIVLDDLNNNWEERRRLWKRLVIFQAKCKHEFEGSICTICGFNKDYQ